MRTCVFGLRVHTDARRVRPRASATSWSKSALRDVFLWDDVKDKLHRKATLLTLEQQQKLCIARLLPLKPRVILMDEPCSALDAEGTAGHRNADRHPARDLHDRDRDPQHGPGRAGPATSASTCCWAKSIEHGKTKDIFLHPQRKETEMYIEGRYG